MMGQTNWRPIAKLMIGGTDKFLGPGSCALLEHIKATGSVRLACERMGLSYSKAWHILDAVEREAGFPVVVRKKGGAGGGETRLTGEGEALIERYRAFERECKEAIQLIFRKHFPEGLDAPNP